MTRIPANRGQGDGRPARTAAVDLIENWAARSRANETLLGHREFLRSVGLEVLKLCGQQMPEAFETLSYTALHICLQKQRACEERDEALAALKALDQSLKRDVTCERVLSKPFFMGGNGDAVRMIYTSSAGRETAGFNCVELPPDAAEPPLLSYGFAIAGKRWLGEAPRPPVCYEEYDVIGVKEAADAIPDLGEVTLEIGGLGRRVLRYVMPDIARDIRRRLEEGEKVSVRCDTIAVAVVLESKAKAEEQTEYVTYLTDQNPTLAELVLPRSLRQSLERLVDALLSGRSFRALFAGPTGNGKSTSTRAILITAGQRSGKRVALIQIGAAYTGSPYANLSEITMRQALQKARTLVAQGYLVVIELGEIDGLVGACDHRQEGYHNRSVRTTAQELFSEDPGPHIGLIATMNVSKDSYLPPAISRRFAKIDFGRPTRRQLAAVCARNADASVLRQRLGITPEELGTAAADALYSDAFIVAKAYFQSGTVVPVRARDLSEACPAKVKSLARAFCEDLRDGTATSLASLFDRMEREFHAVQINENNLFEYTCWPRDHYIRDRVNLVERVLPNVARAEAVA